MNRSALAVVVVVAAGCGPEEPPPCPEETQLTIGSEPIGSAPREIDFGVVEPGLTSSVRVSYVVSCGQFVDGASVDTPGGVFDVVDQTSFTETGHDGFVIVSARPI